MLVSERIDWKLRLLGVALLFVGVCAALVARGVAASQAPYFGLVGVLASVAGSTLALARWCVLFDPGSGTIVEAWGLLIPWWRRARPVSDLASVDVASEPRSHRYGTYHVQRVRLVPETGKPIRLGIYLDGYRAEYEADRLARLLGLPPRPASAVAPAEAERGQIIVRDGGDPYREVTIETRPPSPPPGLRDRVHVDGDLTRVRLRDLGGSRFLRRVSAAMLAAAAVALGLAVAEQQREPALIAALNLCVFGLFVGAIGLPTSLELLASPARVAVRRRSLLPRTQGLRCSEIRAVRIISNHDVAYMRPIMLNGLWTQTPHEIVVIDGGHSVLLVGLDLDQAEREWIAALIDFHTHRG